MDTFKLLSQQKYTYLVDSNYKKLESVLNDQLMVITRLNDLPTVDEILTDLPVEIDFDVATDANFNVLVYGAIVILGYKATSEHEIENEIPISKSISRILSDGRAKYYIDTQDIRNDRYDLALFLYTHYSVILHCAVVKDKRNPHMVILSISSKKNPSDSIIVDQIPEDRFNKLDIKAHVKLGGYRTNDERGLTIYKQIRKDRIRFNL
jgi:hypothetical protein